MDRQAARHQCWTGCPIHMHHLIRGLGKAGNAHAMMMTSLRSSCPASRRRELDRTRGSVEGEKASWTPEPQVCVPLTLDVDVGVLGRTDAKSPARRRETLRRRPRTPSQPLSLIRRPPSRRGSCLCPCPDGLKAQRTARSLDRIHPWAAWPLSVLCGRSSHPAAGGIPGSSALAGSVSSCAEPHLAGPLLPARARLSLDPGTVLHTVFPMLRC